MDVKKKNSSLAECSILHTPGWAQAEGKLVIGGMLAFASSPCGDPNLKDPNLKAPNLKDPNNFIRIRHNWIV